MKYVVIYAWVSYKTYDDEAMQRNGSILHLALSRDKLHDWWNDVGWRSPNIKPTRVKMEIFHCDAPNNLPIWCNEKEWYRINK